MWCEGTTNGESFGSAVHLGKVGRRVRGIAFNVEKSIPRFTPYLRFSS